MLGPAKTIKRLTDEAYIPIDNSNSDYRKFKLNVLGQSMDFDGNPIPAVELQDAEGNVMTEEEVAEFVATLP